MSYWVVIFEDTEEMLAYRKQYGADHIAYLRRHADQIVTAGGFRNAPDTPFTGGMWIVKNASRVDVDALVTQDPYFNPKCRKYAVHYWGKAIDQDVTI